jgi:hypothetical protein
MIPEVSSKRALRWKAALVVCLLALVVSWMVCGLESPQNESTHPEGDHVSRIPSMTVSKPPDGVEGDNGSCTSEDILAADLAAGIASIQCRDELAASRCSPPVPFPDGRTTAEELRAEFSATFSGCSTDAAGIVLDCLEFPCMLLVRREMLRSAASTCPALIPFADVASDVDTIRKVFGEGWEDWVPFDTENLVFDTEKLVRPNGPLSSSVHSRFPARMRRLHERVTALESEARVGGALRRKKLFLICKPPQTLATLSWHTGHAIPKTSLRSRSMRIESTWSERREQWTRPSKRVPSSSPEGHTSIAPASPACCCPTVRVFRTHEPEWACSVSLEGRTISTVQG